MSSRRHRWRGVKTHRNYTVDETARALTISNGTVRRWIKNGLPALTEQKPHLILGADLIEFLNGRNAKRQKLRLHEFYCFTCKLRRQPAFRAIECYPSKGSANLLALCEHCGKPMRKRFPWRSLAALRELADVTIKQADEHLSDSLDARSNVHLREASNPNA